MAFPDGIVDAIDPVRLRLLVEVERRGSISAAAEACRMGQPSATKHLKTLEAALGAKLVERNGRTSGLTEAGRIVAGHGARVLETIDAMHDDLRSLDGAERSTLTIGSSPTPGAYALPPLLQCFADRHPRVDVDVVIGESAWVAERVALGDVSLGLTDEVDLPGGVVAEPFIEGEVIGIAAPGRLTLDCGRAPLAELEAQPLIVREQGSSTRTTAERFLDRARYEPAKRIELDSNEAISGAVRTGLGVAFVWRYSVEAALEHGDLVSFLPEGTEPLRGSVYLLRAEGRELTTAARAFIETICSCCSVSVAGYSAKLT